MAFKNFSEFNKLANQLFLRTDPMFTQVSMARGLVKSMQRELFPVAQSYADSYNAVVEYSYDEDGHPTDITSADRLSVPQNIVSAALAGIDNVKESVALQREAIKQVANRSSVYAQVRFGPSTFRLQFDVRSGQIYYERIGAFSADQISALADFDPTISDDHVVLSDISPAALFVLPNAAVGNNDTGVTVGALFSFQRGSMFVELNTSGSSKSVWVKFDNQVIQLIDDFSAHNSSTTLDSTEIAGSLIEHVMTYYDIPIEHSNFHNEFSFSVTQGVVAAGEIPGSSTADLGDGTLPLDCLVLPDDAFDALKQALEV